MYFPTDKSSAAETLVFNLRYAMKSAHDSMTIGKYSVTNMIENTRPANWQSDISWRAEAWMLESFKLNMLEHAAAILADKTQEAYDAVMSDPQSDSSQEMEEEFNATMEEVALLIRKWMAQEAMRTIYRGVESSSNPMTILSSKAKVDAAKHLIEVLGLSEHSLLNNDAIEDVFGGMARRKRASEERREQQDAITPVKVVLRKEGANYEMAAFNKTGELMESKSTTATKKPDALAIARQWAEDLRLDALRIAEERGLSGEGYNRFNCASPTIEA